MEKILVNLVKNGKVRRVRWRERDWLVAPLRMIVPGVLNGSRGALFYPIEEITKSVDAWNGMPIVVYHPTRNGVNVSARHPSILESSGVGYVYNAGQDTDGALTGEGWFDAEDTKRVDVRVYNALITDTPMELSTGLFTENEPAPNGSVFNGYAYEYTARNYKPDHLAVLPDQTGACSIRDGCGVMIRNTVVTASGELYAESSVLDEETESLNVRNLLGNAALTISLLANQLPSDTLDMDPDKACQDLKDGEVNGHPLSESQRGMFGALCGEKKTHNASKDYLLMAKLHSVIAPAGSDAWIEDAKDGVVIYHQGPKTLKQSYVISKDDKGQEVIALGQDPPIEVTRVTSYLRRPKGRNTMNKQQAVAYLTANCDCWKKPADQAVLNGLPESKIIELANAALATKKAQIVLNLAANKFNPLTNTVVNAATGATEAAGVNLQDLAKFLAIEVDPGQDPAGFIKAIVAKLDDIESQLTGITEPEPSTPDSGAPPSPDGMSANGNKGKGGQATNRQVKVMTDKEWIDSAPPSVRAAVTNAMEVVDKEKKTIILRLVANITDPALKQATANQLFMKTLPDLRMMASLIPTQPQQQPAFINLPGIGLVENTAVANGGQVPANPFAAPFGVAPQAAPLYAGAGGGPVSNVYPTNPFGGFGQQQQLTENETNNTDMMPPRIDWAELAAEQRKK